MAELATTLPPPAKTLEKLLIEGDLSGLSAQERLEYYAKVCESLGLNALTKPFAYIKLNGKLVLYALRDCAEQLRKIHSISVRDMTTQIIGEVYVVRATFWDGEGRCDQATGAVPIKGLAGDALANAYMRAETKCKRRGTLSICGLGMLDETEVETIPDAEADGEKKFKRLTPVRTLAELMPEADLVTPSDPPPMDVTPTQEEAAASAPQQEIPLPLPPAVPRPATITTQQHGALERNVREFAAAFGLDEKRVRETLKAKMGRDLGVEHFPQLTEDQLMTVIGWINEGWRNKGL